MNLQDMINRRSQQLSEQGELTPDDIRSPIPTDVIETGKRSILEMISNRREQLGGQSAVEQRINAARNSQPSPERLEAAAEADRIAKAQLDMADSNVVEGAVGKFIQGAPLVGEWIDEGIDKINPGAGERLRRIQGAMDELYPKTAAAAQITGGVAGSIPLAVGGVGVAQKAATGMGQVLRGLGLGLTGGAIEGASQEAGRAEPGQRTDAAIEGAMVGGGIGAVVGALATPVAGGVQALVRRIKKMDVSTIAQQFGLSDEAAKTMRAALAAEDMDAARQILARNGDDVMLAEAGPTTRQMLDTAQQSSSGAISVSRPRVQQRVAQRGQTLKNTFDELLGPPEGVRAANARVAQRTAAKRKAAYDLAYRTPIDYGDGGAGQRVLEVVSEVPPRFMRQASVNIDDAIRQARLNGDPYPQQLMIKIADDGSVAVEGMPSVMELDFLKRALGDVAESGKDAVTGRMSPEAVTASNFARELRDSLVDAAEPYGRALKLGGDKIAEQNALDMGRRVLTQNVTLEDVTDTLRGASDEVKDGLRQGLRQNLDRVMERARTTLTEIEAGAFDFETGQNVAKESLDALRQLTVPENFKKVNLILGGDAKLLRDELQKTADAMALQVSLGRNSATAARTAGLAMVREETQPGFLRRVMGNAGNPFDGAKEITQTLAGIDPASISEAQRGVLTEIADALTGIQGEEAVRALEAVQRAMSGQALKDAEAQLIGRAVAGSLAAAAGQTAPRLLEQTRQ